MKDRDHLKDAVVGDLVIATDGVDISAIEQVSDSTSAVEIVTRWRAQYVVVNEPIEVWEAMPGFFYRRRE